jgi:hypothetical protein
MNEIKSIDVDKVIQFCLHIADLHIDFRDDETLVMFLKTYLKNIFEIEASVVDPTVIHVKLQYKNANQIMNAPVVRKKIVYADENWEMKVTNPEYSEIVEKTEVFDEKVICKRSKKGSHKFETITCDV